MIQFVITKRFPKRLKANVIPEPTVEEGPSSPPEPSNVKFNEAQMSQKNHRRRNEDHLAVVLMAIVLVFLICHSPRIILDIHDLITMNQTMMCKKKDTPYVRTWFMVTTSFSSLLLVINSSVNMVIYCLLGSKFRAEIIKTATGVCKLFARRQTSAS